MEVKQEEMTEVKWSEMSQIARDNICAECQADLTIYTIAETASMRAGCVRDKSHRGFVRRETWTEAYRRGALVPQPIQSAIEKKMVPKDDLGRAMNLLALRYPDAIKDPPTAALFILDCARLDLDPLIQPAEAVPIPFKSRKKDAAGKVIEEKVTVAMVITGDGWLSMAARGCRDDWLGPPKIMRLEDYLMTLPEHKERSYDEVKELAKDIKQSACKDDEAWYYMAVGKRRGMDEDAVVPGYFTHRDYKRAEAGHLPAFDEPGNQATWRAQKKWVRKVYPECRQRMMELTTEWYQRAEGIKAAQEYIDAEYRFISTEGEETAEQDSEKVGVAAPAKSKVQERKAEAATAEEMSPEEAIEGEGFSINMSWLNESKKALNWNDETMKSFVVSKYKVDGRGTVTEVLQRLTREQAEEFVKTIQEKVDQKQIELFT